MTAEMRFTDDYSGKVIDDGVYYEVLLEAPPTPTGNQRFANLHFQDLTGVLRVLLANDFGKVAITKRTLFNIVKHNHSVMESGYPSATNSAEESEHVHSVDCPCPEWLKVGDRRGE